MTKLGTFYCLPQNPRTLKVQIAAKYAGVELETVPNFAVGVANKAPEFLSKFPFGKVPVLDSAEGPVYESNAIAYYVATHKPEFLGKKQYEQSLVMQYLFVADNEVIPPASAWVYPMLGYLSYNEAAFKKAQEDTHKVLRILDQILAPRTFLVGESVTLADVAMAASVSVLFKLVLDASVRKQYVNLTRWFVTIINQPNAKAVVGEFTMCEKPMTYDPSRVQCTKPAAEKPKPEQANHAVPSAATEEEEEERPKPKEKNPLDLLPPTKFNLEDWKRFYSNNEARPTSINYFWENYDPEGYSIWRIDYKYNEELTKIFMTCNLVNGLFQRMERLRKYAFGSVLVFGEDDKNDISGYFVFRGHEIPPEMIDVPDYESYTFKRVDIKDSKSRELFNDYLAWDGELEGKSFNQGKAFK